MKSKWFLIVVALILFNCKDQPKDVAKSSEAIKHVRHVHDTIGFTKYSWQLDSIYKRLNLVDSNNNLNWKAAICPHDDYKYAGRLYYESLKGINANTIILVGVAHRARNYKLQDKIIFANFTHWESPYGDLKVSELNQKIIDQLSNELYTVHDDMQELEHSLEAIVPFLHRKNPELEIIPILVPYINYDTIDGISSELSSVVADILKTNDLNYGDDVAIVISNDAVHYGNDQWSDDLAPYGVDDKGTKRARQKDLEIIETCLVDTINSIKVKRFTEYTVQHDDYKEYKWVWCGRYSVPFGVAFSNALSVKMYNEPLIGTFLDYESSIDHKLIEVEDLGMGTTAIATQQHWVAYASIKYE